jgi:preprotein translocase subunit YajC
VNQQLILLVVVMGALFYLLIYRPQSRAKRQREELDRSLAVGSQVVTIGGMHGEILALDGDTADVEVADGVVITFDRKAIAASVADDDEVEEDEVEDEDIEDEIDDELEVEDEAAADAAPAEGEADADEGADRPA